MNYMTTLGKSGRRVIPAPYRKALGLSEGDGVMISLKNGHIEISPVDESIKKAQKKVGQYLQQKNDLVDILFENRKEESTHER